MEQLLRTRIVILDGAMGTMIQAFKLDEAGYRRLVSIDTRALRQQKLVFRNHA